MMCSNRCHRGTLPFVEVSVLMFGDHLTGFSQLILLKVHNLTFLFQSA